MSDVALLSQLVRDLIPESLGEFKPFAFYQEQMDRIQVVTADCSVTEITITNNLSLLQRNHTEYGQLTYVGFVLEGARHFCRTNDLPFEGEVKISTIIERMAKVDTKSMPAILDIALPMLQDHGIDEVEFPSD